MTVKNFIDLAKKDEQFEIWVWKDGDSPCEDYVENSFYHIDERLYNETVKFYTLGYCSINLHI